MKIGIDLGSTYSGFARYDGVNDKVEAISLKEGEPISIPSVVFFDSKGNVYTGQSAKSKMSHAAKGRCFEHFKMLLNENDQSIISARGYDNNYTPRKIIKLFLESNIKAVLKNYNDSKVEDVCICVPEIWVNGTLSNNQGVSTLDGPSILREILQREIDIPTEHVQVVTEPEAASAYFAFNYEERTNKNFNGYLLLIDYGGGTLDITLTEVLSSGTGCMEICYRDGCGAGENHIDSNGNRIVGNAGISYLQAVVYSAIKEDENFCDSEVNTSDSDFVAAMVDFENVLKDHDMMQQIEDYFGSFYSSYSEFGDCLNQETEEFASFSYRGEEIWVSYQCLYKAYKENIEGILSKQIKHINSAIAEKYIKDDPRKPSSGNMDNFKIALVGGFVGCYFVRAQLYEIYNFDADVKNDPRVNHISTDKKEQAISLGAALIAANRVKLQKTSRYSIGLYASDASGKYKPYYGIRLNQVIVPNKPYFMLRDYSKKDEPGNRVVYGNLAGIKQFVIEFPEHEGWMLMTLNPVMLNKLKDLPAMNFWNCGFSMDDSNVVSFHILPSGSEDISKGKTIRLDSYRNLFDLSAM